MPGEDTQSQRLVLPIDELAFLREILKEITRTNKVLAELKKSHDEYWKLNDEIEGITYDRNARQERLRLNRNAKKCCEFFFNSCYNMLTEMMDMEVIIRAEHDQILNLCSAPGGFSKKLIEMSRQTRVTAVTLPTTEPGALDNLFEDERQNLIKANVVELAQMPLHELYSILGCCQDLEWRRGNAKTDGKPKFDLALLDGAWASDQEETKSCSKEMPLEDNIQGWRNNLRLNLQLRMSEVAIACATLKQNGMLIARSISKIQNPQFAINWLLFKQKFRQVEIYYPSTDASSNMWSQSFIYFVCRGYQHSEQEVANVYQQLQGYLVQVANARFDFVTDIYNEASIKELESEMEKVWRKQTDKFKLEYERLELSRETLVDRGQDMIEGAEDDMPSTSTSTGI